MTMEPYIPTREEMIEYLTEYEMITGMDPEDMEEAYRFGFGMMEDNALWERWLDLQGLHND